MKYLSLFSGIGGFELGIQKAYDNSNQQFAEIEQNRERGNRDIDERGIDVLSTSRTAPLCIGYSEIDKYAIQVYQSHFNHTNYGDITKINETELPDFDLLVGGFPCQAFSIAGKRMGFDDTRGNLFFDIARILKEKRPRNFILENVKGLLSHDNGRTFKIIITTLNELGYCVEWQVLNAKNFGVPQNRERVFIVGHLGGIPERKVFPITGSTNEIITDDKIIDGYNKNYRKDFGSIRTNSGCHTACNLIQLNQPTHSNDRVYGTDGLSPTLNTMQGGNRQPFIPEESRIRRLTPLECERLMGFPDGWTDIVSDTQRYKTLGNGVVSNVVAEIVKKLL